MRPGFMRFVLATCLLCTVAVSANAHERYFHQGDDERPGPDECQVDREGLGGIDQDRDTVERDARVLERCKGVLIPPRTGDDEMVEPAPDIGTTPVIPPDFVPDQPPGPDYP
ncbi:hypothetical protein [Phyllobacterium zundukense]|uniref:Uncharacterized protein n=1 Tax=Phyllobacterium zundukense TaxID=1867719 RepID=A0A2N9VV41_9HYPH|nr:hypothetical protein [Phyllobacterium zundukense]ATU94970.1 hypothetical protein BLM14_24900 [Phyllobacterium zundukense]PIO43359.1 hypothetical protein B5P45_18735 [Phyllobacterium zundukense]